MGFIISHLSVFLLSNQYNGMQECFFLSLTLFVGLGWLVLSSGRISSPVILWIGDLRIAKLAMKPMFFTSVGVNRSGLNMYCGPNLFITVHVTFK